VNIFMVYRLLIEYKFKNIDDVKISSL